MLKRSRLISRLPRHLAYSVPDPVSRTSAVAVALDGTPRSERSLPFAASVARKWNAPLRLLHVRNPVEEAHHTDLVVIDTHDSLSVRSRAGAYLEGLASRMKAAHDLDVEVHPLTGSSVADRLRTACEQNIRVLVMVRSNRSALSRLWQGSVTKRLVDISPVPLLLVPDDGSSADLRDGSAKTIFDRILVHLDGFDDSNATVESVAAVAGRNARCHLIRVLPLSAFHNGGLSRTFNLRTQAWLQLLKAKAYLANRGISAEAQLLFDARSPVSVLAAQANAIQPQLVVVASKDHFLPRWMRTGGPETLYRRVDLPVLILPHGTTLASSLERSATDQPAGRVPAGPSRLTIPNTEL